MSGAGADGAYHAGVVRALVEAGVKIDLVCGRGIGAAGAVFTAIGGASHLWEEGGPWRARGIASLYRWRWSLRTLTALLAVLALVVCAPLLALALGFVVSLVALLFGMAGVDAGTTLADRYAALVATAFSADALPTWLPRLVTLALVLTAVVLATGMVVATVRMRQRRHVRGGAWWSVFGAPLTARGAATPFVRGLWGLLRGGGHSPVPEEQELSRRYADVLADSIGQPGFNELLLVVHDLDARCDLVFGLLREPYRGTRFGAAAQVGTRAADAFDLAGDAREHLIDVLRGALMLPHVCEPALLTFTRDGYWRGETHRLIDRPGALARLLEEAAAAGAQQAIIVAASPASPRAHELSRPRTDPRSRFSEQLAASDAAMLRDIEQHLAHLFHASYVVRPLHNPVGALDFDGAFDERSDRRQSLAELIDRGYSDAHQQFIGPVIARSGEGLSIPR